MMIKLFRPKQLPSYKTLAVAWALVFGGLTALSVWNDLHSRPDQASDTVRRGQNVRTAAVVADPASPTYITKPIGEVRPIVDWALGQNPEIAAAREYVDQAGRYLTDFGPLDPPNWRVVHFRMTKDDGSDLDIWLGRTLSYLEELGATEVGGKVWMEMPEFGAVGHADVVSIAQCPQPPPRPSDEHYLVTGRFVHSSSEFLCLTIEGIKKPIEATGNHLFWSEDRQTFVTANDLAVGEHLRVADRSAARLIASVPRDGSAAAYNVEVDGQHVFRVSTSGVLVHNACAPRGGRYGDVRAGNKGGQVHHTPASAVSPYTHHTGPSVWMEAADHKLTASWGRSKAAQAYRQKQADLIADGKIREAVQMDIDDIRSKFGNKYDDHIQEMLEAFGDEF